MNAKQLRAALSELGYPIDTVAEKAEAAEFLGVEPRTLYRYLDGTRKIPRTIERLLEEVKKSSR